MTAVGAHDRFFIDQPSEDGEKSIENRHSQNQHRDRNGKQCRALDRAQYGKGGEHEAQKQRTAVSHKDLGRIKVKGQKAQRAAGNRQHCAGRLVGSVNVGGVGYAQRNDRRGTGCQSVKAVDEIDGVGDTHDPDDGDHEAEHRAQLAVALPEKVGDKLDADAVYIHHHRYRQLADKLKPGRKPPDVVNDAQQVDEHAADHDINDPFIEAQKSQHAHGAAHKDGQPAEARHGLVVHPASIAGYIHGPYLGRQLDRQRTYYRGQSQSQQKCHK